MDCPKCVGVLKERKIGTKEPVTVNVCFVCGGIWFDKNELELLINKEIFDTVEFNLEAEPIGDIDLKKEIDLDKKEAICPCCKGSKKMIKKISNRNKNVSVDFCKDCGGVWLDSGEYAKISRRSPIEKKMEVIIDFLRLHFPHIFKENL
jgi:Zn-finger nucleic acid-binding protein